MPKTERSREHGRGLPLAKAHGQHLLKNPLLTASIVDKAEIKPSDVVLEVGPGTGNLTVKLLDKGRRVIAVERDRRMAAELSKRVMGTPQERKLQILIGDVLKTPVPRYDVLVSNTPYQISTPLIDMVLRMDPIPPSTLMVQREVAMRCVARPGDDLYCRLSVNVQLWSKCTHLIKVSRNSFRPPPKVDSSVIRIVGRKPQPVVDKDEWEGWLKVCFVRKNKTLGALMKSDAVLKPLESGYHTFCQLADISQEEQVSTVIERVLSETNMTSTRPGKMKIDDFVNLLAKFNQAGISFR